MYHIHVCILLTCQKEEHRWSEYRFVIETLLREKFCPGWKARKGDTGLGVEEGNKIKMKKQKQRNKET